jgi:hypothetical protein
LITVTPKKKKRLIKLDLSLIRKGLRS